MNVRHITEDEKMRGKRHSKWLIKKKDEHARPSEDLKRDELIFYKIATVIMVKSEGWYVLFRVCCR